MVLVKDSCSEPSVVSVYAPIPCLFLLQYNKQCGEPTWDIMEQSKIWRKKQKGWESQLARDILPVFMALSWGIPFIKRKPKRENQSVCVWERERERGGSNISLSCYLSCILLLGSTYLQSWSLEPSGPKQTGLHWTWPSHHCWEACSWRPISVDEKEHSGERRCSVTAMTFFDVHSLFIPHPCSSWPSLQPNSHLGASLRWLIIGINVYGLPRYWAKYHL